MDVSWLFERSDFSSAGFVSRKGTETSNYRREAQRCHIGSRCDRLGSTRDRRCWNRQRFDRLLESLVSPDSFSLDFHLADQRIHCSFVETGKRSLASLSSLLRYSLTQNFRSHLTLTRYFSFQAILRSPSHRYILRNCCSYYLDRGRQCSSLRQPNQARCWYFTGRDWLESGTLKLESCEGA